MSLICHPWQRSEIFIARKRQRAHGIRLNCLALIPNTQIVSDQVSAAFKLLLLLGATTLAGSLSRSCRHSPLRSRRTNNTHSFGGFKDFSPFPPRSERRRRRRRSKFAFRRDAVPATSSRTPAVSLLSSRRRFSSLFV